jgi:hypothetical protein
MTDLFSVFLVSKSQAMKSKRPNFTKQILQAKFPDMDLRDGTGLSDLVIRPISTALAIINKSQEYFFVQNTISGVDNDTPPDIVDKIMSNWFLTRKIGTQAVINARVYFARQKEVSITTDVFFSPDNTLKYFPAVSLTVPNGQLTFDSFQNEYYVDIDLTAEKEGTDYNISSGSLLYFSNFDPYFLHAEINFLKSASSLSESNSEFITRAKTAVSTRNLINVPSIISKMLEDFPLLNGVTPIGMGDAEMIRDQVWAYVPALTPPKALIHTGGKVDVYCRVPLKVGITQVTTDINGKANLNGAIYKIKRSSIAGSAIADTLPFYITKAVTSITRASTTATVTTTTPHGFSTNDSITIIGAVQTGYNGTFTIINTGASTFTYTVPNTLTTPATGTITANKEVPFTVSNAYSVTQTLSSLTSSGNTATGTLAGHGLSIGRYVTVSGATPSGYNGQFIVTSTPTQDTFTYTIAGPLSSPATGTIQIKAVDPQNDFGFSNYGIQTVDFTSSYPSQTASFEISYFQDIDGVQTYLEDDARKVLCGGYLARGYNIYLLDFTITAYNGAAPDATKCTTIIETYLKALEPAQLFIMNDLIGLLQDGGITTIKNPLTLTYTYYNRDLITPLTGTITDYHDTNDRTAIYMLSSVTTNSQTI